MDNLDTSSVSAQLHAADERTRVALDTARVLFENGDQTSRTIRTVQAIAAQSGSPSTLFPSWGRLELFTPDGDVSSVQALPVNVNMARVVPAIDAAVRYLRQEISLGDLESRIAVRLDRQAPPHRPRLRAPSRQP